MEGAPYRHAPALTKAQRLAQIGRERRLASGVDPHAAPSANVHSAVLDVIAAIDAPPGARGTLLRAWMPFVASVLLVAGVAVGSGFPRLVPVVILAAAVVIGVVTVREREAPRRWLAGAAVRIDGYLDLVGREELVERPLARVEFERDAPEVQFVRDLLTGAGVESGGVDERSPGVFVVHGPALAGSAQRLHRWFRSLVDRALTPLHAEHPIARVTVEER